MCNIEFDGLCFLRYFQFGTTMNKAVINIFVPV